jgi:hypothetical protein
MNIMNKILKTMAFLLTVVLFASCLEDTTEGVTRITYYPSITILGDGFVVVGLGSTYNDAGCTVILNGEDVSDQAIITSNVNTTRTGLYTVTYKAVNTDGFSRSASRTVYVADLANVYEGDLSGDYTSMITRLVKSTGATADRGPYTLTLTKLAEGHYTIKDLPGGWYWIGGGSSYASYRYEGIIRVAADGKLSSNCTYSAPWGGVVSIISGTYDPATSTFAYDATGDANNGLGAYIWSVTLTK